MLLLSEAEVIKEKVKAAPVKKGINRNEMIILLIFTAFTSLIMWYCLIESEAAKEKAPEPKPEPTKKGVNMLKFVF